MSLNIMNISLEDPNDFRLNISKKINTIIGFDTNKTCGKNIEKGIYNYCIKEASKKNIIKKWNNYYFKIIYMMRLKSILTNLQKNEKLRQLIINKTLSYEQLAYITHQEMDHSRWDTLIKEKIERDKSKYEVQRKINSEFTCFKCNSNNCDYYQLQTRSADEPMTTFVSCLECGNRWKC